MAGREREAPLVTQRREALWFRSEKYPARLPRPATLNGTLPPLVDPPLPPPPSKIKPQKTN